MNSEKQSTNLQMTLREVNRVGEVKKNIPKLRFRGYEDAWEQRRLEEIFLKIRNAFVGTSTPYYVEKNQGGHFYIESNNVKHGKINHDTEVFINEEFYQNQKDKWLKTGDIVMVQSGHVGHSAVIPEYLNNSAAHALIMFQEYKIETNPYFINFQFQTESVRNKIDSITTGNTIKHILASDMKLFSISNTQKKEADKLGDFFISLDNLITLHQRKYDALKSMKKTLLSKMFPKNGEDVPEIRFKEFTDAWEQRKFGNIIQIERGGSPRPIEEYITTSSDGLNWVKIGDAPNQGNYITSTSEKIRPEGLSKTREVYPGDLILSNSMSFGKPYIMAIKGCIHDGWLLLRDKNNYFDLIFLCNLLGTPQMLQQYKGLAAGSTVNNLNKELVSSTQVCIPNIEEQKTIGIFFETIDNLITLHQRKLDGLKNMKKTLLQQMFV